VANVLGSLLDGAGFVGGAPYRVCFPWCEGCRVRIASFLTARLGLFLEDGGM